MSFFKQFFKTLQPDKFFLVCASVFGLIFLVLIPPFQTPDEINHFYRSYQIADGHLIAQSQDNRVGGDIPQSLFIVTQSFQAMAWSSDIKTDSKTILEKFYIPLKPEDKSFIDFPNTAMYSPISYAPQATVLFYLKPFELSPLTLFYWARITSLLFWVIGIYYTIRFIPFYKWTFALLALLPMSVVTNMSISADVVTNVLAFFSIAYVLKLAYEEPKVSRQQFLVLGGLMFLLASAKIVYAPLMLIVLLIPKGKFGSIKAYYTKLLVLGVIGLITALFWSSIMADLYLPFSQYNPNHRNSATLINCADMHQQWEYISSHGGYIIAVFIHSMAYAFDMYAQGFIGTFGWLDTHLPIWFIVLAYAVILVVALIDGSKEFDITPAQKCILLTSFECTLVLILLSQHLTWDCVGGDVIATIQGRYFIPVAPLLFLMFYNQKFMNPKRVVYFVIVFCVFSLILSLNVVYNRYYKEPKAVETIDIICDAEQTEGAFYKSNLPQANFENAPSQSKDKARSGSYSAKINANDPFAFTYRMYDCGKGDHIRIDVWRYGKSGRIYLGNDTNHIKYEVLDPIEKDSLGWEHLQLDYVVPMDLKGQAVAIYVFNGDADVAYFDDLHIVHSKFE